MQRERGGLLRRVEGELAGRERPDEKGEPLALPGEFPGGGARRPGGGGGYVRALHWTVAEGLERRLGLAQKLPGKHISRPVQRRTLLWAWLNDF